MRNLPTEVWRPKAPGAFPLVLFVHGSSGFRTQSTWLTTALALFTVIEVIVHSNVYGKFNATSVTTLIVVLGAGPIIYLIASALRRQRNQLDLSMAMRELPPE